ncbi:MAG TPA: DUF2231 domain-containing protein [Usitatibacter sp.]|jgi:uncharacterized membrane protein|nr:DUF2231 domain-containing protein [Usitatibacter sp.]
MRAPIHPMLVPVAIGALVLSFMFDVVSLSTGRIEPWSTVASFTMTGGIVGLLIVTLSGWINSTSLPEGSRTKKIALTHLELDLMALAPFIASAWLRHENASPAGIPFILSLMGIGLLIAVSGWLGDKLVLEIVASAGNPPAGLRPANRPREA